VISDLLEGGGVEMGQGGRHPAISVPLSHPNQRRRFCEALNGRKFKRDLSVEEIGMRPTIAIAPRESMGE